MFSLLFKINSLALGVNDTVCCMLYYEKILPLYDMQENKLLDNNNINERSPSLFYV